MEKEKIQNEEIVSEEVTGKEEQENAIVTTESHELSSGLFANNDSKVRKMTSLDLNEESNVDMLLNGTQDCDFKLNDKVGTEIVCIGCYATEKPVDVVNEDTGEIITRKKHTLMLFDKDGKSYVTGSNACYLSFEIIVSFKGLPTKENPLTLIPIKQQAKENGHAYLKLKLKMTK